MKSKPLVTVNPPGARPSQSRFGAERAKYNALRKLEVASKQIPLNANPATAHMFIVNPLSGGGLTTLFSTHPPMEQRIARLEKMAYGPIE